MQQLLQDKGHYRGKVDGVLGLRTRASIRGFQKVEKLPVTGKLDNQTAGKLGVSAESNSETSREMTKGKPAAGIKWASGSRRTNKTRRSSVSTFAAPEIDGADTVTPLQTQPDKRNE